MSVARAPSPRRKRERIPSVPAIRSQSSAISGTRRGGLAQQRLHRGPELRRPLLVSFGARVESVGGEQLRAPAEPLGGAEQIDVDEMAPRGGCLHVLVEHLDAALV